MNMSVHIIWVMSLKFKQYNTAVNLIPYVVRFHCNSPTLRILRINYNINAYKHFKYSVTWWLNNMMHTYMFLDIFKIYIIFLFFSETIIFFEYNKNVVRLLYLSGTHIFCQRSVIYYNLTPNNIDKTEIILYTSIPRGSWYNTEVNGCIIYTYILYYYVMHTVIGIIIFQFDVYDAMHVK
jgi:hypothetical protein